MSSNTAGSSNSKQAIFVQGSILRHILVMSSTSTVGLLSLFMVDLLDMYFLSLLGDNQIVAAVGFSSTLMFLLFSMCIGITDTESNLGFNSKNVNQLLQSNGWLMPVFDIDIEKKQDFELLIEALLNFYKP